MYVRMWLQYGVALVAIAIGSCHTLPSNALIAQVIAVCVVQVGLEALKHCM